MRAAGFLLCGGKSSRMGRDKALLELGGEPLVARGLRTLGEVCDEVAIAGGAEGLAAYGRVIPDGRPGCGPLGGIVAALEQSSAEWNVFLPVDAPFVPGAVLRALLGALLGAAGGVGAVASAGGRVQPLCAVYARGAVEALRGELEAGRWKVADAVRAAGEVVVVEFPDPAVFANLNTPDDFASVESTGNQFTAATLGS